MIYSISSTGGLIALGLGSRNWAIEECIRKFEDLCKTAFTRRLGASIPLIGTIVTNLKSSVYGTVPLEEVLMKEYRQDEYLFGGPRPSAQYGCTAKVAVTSASNGRPIVLSNYNRRKIPDTTCK